MERRAQAAEALSARSTGQSALDCAIQAAELYMRAAAETNDKSHASRLRRKCKDLIARAEVLKGKLAKVDPAEAESRSILQRASRLHGNEFPPWDADPKAGEFLRKEGEENFSDDAVFTMSSAQEAILDAWKRPGDIFNAEQVKDTQTFMEPVNDCDLVQDVTTDCSVVASLSAALNILTGKRAVLSSIMYPFDREKGLPKFSECGKYVLRMHFNGCARRVVVDDKLPVSQTERTLFVVDRRNPHLIWPAIIEKAYLKVRGGYDFPGSNSGTDLWVITGWIPEQVFLQREDLDVKDMWNRIKAAHESEDVAITLGTGRISPEEEDVTGLIGEHDYAVVGLHESNGIRQLLLKNPWCNGLSREDPTQNDTKPASGVWSQHENASPGLQVMSLENVVQNFESLYLNWNPALFPHRQNHHFAWELPKGALSASLVRNPQYSITCAAAGPVWVLVSRHFADAELDIARRRPEPYAADAPQLGFMGVLVFDNHGKRVQVGDGELYRSPYVDSPQTLARLEAKPGTTYTVVIDQHQLPLPSYTFTLCLFSQDPLQVGEAKEQMKHHVEQEGAWKRRSAGGSVASPTFHINPQYKIEIIHETPLSLLLATDSHEIPVRLDLVWANGERVHEIKVRDLVGSSGDYRRNCAVANIASVAPGVYTLVCSTFERDQTAAFAIRVGSMVPVSLSTVPPPGAGRLPTPLPPISFAAGQHRKRAPITISWLTRASVKLSCAEDASQRTPHSLRASSGLMIRLLVVFGWEPNQRVVAESGDGTFQEATADLRTPEFDLEPGRAQAQGLWLVVESIGNHAVDTPSLEGEIWSDAMIQVGPWQDVP